MTRNSQHGTQKPSAWYALGLKIIDEFQFCLTGESFPWIRGNHVLFWAFEDDLGGRDGSENYCGFF